MEVRVCAVKECGARVVMAMVDGVEIALNPVSIKVVVPAPSPSEFHMVNGFQPHAQTCVDVSGRIKR